jgi:hypothetical protein
MTLLSRFVGILGRESVVIKGDIKTLYYPTDAQIYNYVDTIRVIIKYLKIFKIAPTCFGSQGIHHQGALYSAWLKLL